jgi:hypothetical protein
MKKKWKIDQHTLNAQRKFVFTDEFGATTKKNLLFSLAKGLEWLPEMVNHVKNG